MNPNTGWRYSVMFTALVALLASFVLAPLTAQAQDKPKEEPKKEEAKKSWTDVLKIGGAVRMRNQIAYSEQGLNNAIVGYGVANWRPRFRVLLNIGVTIDDFSAFVQLGTGGTPQSANADYDNVFPINAIGIRQAYLHAQFLEKKLSVALGQFAIRDRGMFASILTWDTDVAAVGAHFGFKVIENKSKDAKGKEVTDMALTINALATFLDNGANIDQRVLGFAGSVDMVFATMFRAGLGMWFVTDNQNIIGSAAFANLGTRHDFQVGELYFQANLIDKTLKAYLHAIMNFGSPDKRRTGYLVGVTLFDAKEVGNVEVDVMFYFLEQFAWAQGLSDADAGNGGTPIGSGTAVGSSGIELNWKWQVAKGLYLGMEINVAYLLGDQLGALDDHDLFTALIFDVEFKW